MDKIKETKEMFDQFIRESIAENNKGNNNNNTCTTKFDMDKTTIEMNVLTPAYTHAMLPPI